MEISPAEKGIQVETRLVFYSWVEQGFYKMEILPAGHVYRIEDKKILQRPFDYKYKLQVRRDDRWQDATRYFQLAEETKLKEFLLDQAELSTDEKLELVDIYLPEPQEWIARRLKSTIYLLYWEIETNPEFQKSNLQWFLKEISKRKHRLPENGLWINVSFYLNQRLKIQKFLSKRVFADKGFDQVRKIVRRNWRYNRFFRRRIGEAEDQDLQLAKVFAGHLYSLLGERDKAVLEYEQATLYDTNFTELFVYDIGIHTFTRLENARDFQNEIIFPNEDSVTERDLTVLMSVDPKFLRIYGSPHFYTKLVQSDLHLHIHVIGEPEETLPVIEEARELYSRMAQFQGSGKRIVPLSFSSERCPDFVAAAKTYFACSRFIHAEYFMDHFNSDVYIMDVDMIFDREAVDFFEELKEYDLGLSFSSSSMVLTPWRRVMGGNVYVANKLPSRKFIRDVRAYILQNLDKPVSWTLDQNALLCAYERLETTQPDIKLASINQMKRPMFQPLYRQSVERGL